MRRGPLKLVKLSAAEPAPIGGDRFVDLVDKGGFSGARIAANEKQLARTLGRGVVGVDDLGHFRFPTVEPLRQPENAGMIRLAKREGGKIGAGFLICRKAFLKVVLEASRGLVSVVGVLREEAVDNSRKNLRQARVLFDQGNRLLRQMRMDHFHRVAACERHLA